MLCLGNVADTEAENKSVSEFAFSRDVVFFLLQEIVSNV